MADWVARVQSEFPALVATQDWVLCDAPTGTQVISIIFCLSCYCEHEQVHSSVTAAISRQLNSASANLGGSYPGALNTIQGVARAREAAAAFLNCEPREIVFGPNMTSITQQVQQLTCLCEHHNLGCPGCGPYAGPGQQPGGDQPRPRR